MGAVKAAIADGVLTFMWVFCASTFGILTSLISGYIGLENTQWMASLFITTVLVFAFLFIFGIIGDLLGGATFNPTATAAFHAVGLGGSNSLYSAALRFPAQVSFCLLSLTFSFKFVFLF